MIILFFSITEWFLDEDLDSKTSLTTCRKKEKRNWHYQNIVLPGEKILTEVCDRLYVPRRKQLEILYLRTKASNCITAVVLSRRYFFFPLLLSPPWNIWPCLDTFCWGGACCHWSLGERGQGWCQTFYNAQKSSWNKELSSSKWQQCSHWETLNPGTAKELHPVLCHLYSCWITFPLVAMRDNRGRFWGHSVV